MTAKPTTIGYRRADHVYGVRNHVVVMSSVHCVNPFVEEIARRAPGVVPVVHQHGCSQMGDDLEQTLRTLAGVCGHPNVFGALIVELGCESAKAADILARVRRDDGRVHSLGVQAVGDAEEIVRQGAHVVEELMRQAAEQRPESFDLADLVLGVECGGSDPFSGITANPAVGRVSDRLVALGGTVILSEVPELIGTEEILARRAAGGEIGTELSRRTENYIRAAQNMGGDLLGANPGPGNIRAGLSTIEEKSLGCVAKGGTSPVQEVLDYGQAPSKKGLVIMDTPGNDGESVTGMVAGGAHIVLFTTGLGTPLGFPIAPVVKIASNSQTYRRMRSFIDVDAGRALEGSSLDDVADEIFRLVLRIGGGEKTLAEKLSSSTISINRAGPTF